MKFFTTICALSAVAAASELATKVEKRQAASPSIPYVAKPTHSNIFS